ncbi:MAG TPA: alpha/beta hydrolase [Rubrobacteraceae bacterium]|nr:alpha/beta hydrolase [Rubrobacteraceae bacterium]
MSEEVAWVIIAAMSTALIVLLLFVGIVVAASVALGRTAYEVESARDTEYLELEGTWVRYNVIGGGPPVLLVHGWLSSSRIWEQLAARLAQRFTVYTLDLTGFGESDKPLSGYGVRNGSRLLYAFCAHFGLTRASVVAHDLAGDMAVKLAADHPDVVGRLVLVATPADDDQIDLPTPLWLATLPVLGPIFYTLGRFARPVRRLWVRPFVADPDDLTEEVIEDAGRSTPAAAANTLTISRREISRGRLARQARIIKIPVLVIAGEEDQIVDPQAVGAWARSVDKAEVCLLDSCGHLPMIESTAEFNAQILAFLTGDARYLEYVEPAAVSEDESAAYDEGVPVDEPAPPPELFKSADDTADLTPPQEEPDAGTGRVEELPNVVRRREGVFPPRDSGADDESSDGSPDDGTEVRRRTPRTGRKSPAEDIIPELPEELFDWPEPRDEFRYGDRARRRPPEDGENGSEAPEEPPRP